MIGIRGDHMATKGEAITTKFSVDITELKAGIQEANRQIRIAQSEFKATSSAMDETALSADDLQSKIDKLTDVHDAQAKKLDLLKQEYKAVADEQGETSKAAQELLIKVNNQQTAVNKTAAEIGKYSKQLDTLQKESEEAANSVEEQKSSYEKLQDTISEQENTLGDLKKQYASVVLEQGKSSKEAKDLAKQIKSLSGDFNKSRTEMYNAETAADKFDKTIDDLGGSAEKASDGFTVFKGAISNFAGNLMSSAAGAIKDFAGNIIGLADSTREYRDEMAKLSTAAQDNGYDINYAKAAYMDLYGVLGDQTAANTTISNFLAMGASTETLDSLLNSSMGIWAKYGDSIPLDGLAESVNETARVAQVTGTLADAINWGVDSNERFGVSLRANTEENKAWNDAVNSATSAEDFFNLALQECSTEQERQQLIADTLSATYGDLAESYLETNDSAISARQAQASLEDSLSKIGEAVEPVTTAFTRGIDNMLRKAMELTDGLDLTPVLTMLDDAFYSLNNEILPKVIEGFQWIIDHKDQIIAGIQGIAAGFVAFKALSFISTIVSTISGLVTVISSASGVMGVLGAAVAALGGPVTIAIAAITALVGGFTYLWNTSESFRNFWIGLWDAITSFCSSAVDAIINFFTVTIPEGINAMITWFQQLPERISEFLSTAVSNVATWASDMAQKAVETGTNFLNNIVTFFQQLPERIGYFIGYALGSVVSWAGNMITQAIQTGSNFLSNVVNFFKQLPGNVQNFLTNTINNIINWGERTVSTGKQKASEFLDSVVNFFSQLPSRVWQFLSNVISDLISWGSDLVSNGRRAAGDMADAIVNAVSSLPDQMLSIGSNIVHGIWDGISGAAGWLWDQVTSFASGIVDGFTSALDINSPSKVFADESEWIPAGVGVGIKDNEKAALKPVQALTAKMRKAASGLKSLIPDDVQTTLSASVGNLRKGVAGTARAVAGTVENVKEIVFNQYNTSPKALSRLDIYRQTKNQLFAAKGRVQSV